MTLIIGDVEKY